MTIINYKRGKIEGMLKNNFFNLINMEIIFHPNKGEYLICQI